MAFTPSKYIDAQGNPTDPNLVAFAQALRKQESNNDPLRIGDNGTAAGAYQWSNGKTAIPKGGIPANFQAGARSLGLNPNDFSAENQNKVAYLQMAQDKDAGLQPYEIAAKWNSGNKDNWKDHKGTVVLNGKTISYDTPAYVNAVMQNFQAARGGAAGAPAALPTTPTLPALPPMTATQTADSASASQHGALFPSVTGDSPLSAGLKTLGNLPGSVFGFAKGVVDTLNPLNTIKNLAAIPGAFSGLVHDTGGVGNALAATAKELPGQAYQALVPEAGRDLITAAHGGFTGNQSEVTQGLEAAQRAITNDPFGQVAPFVFAGKGAADAIDTVTGKVAEARMGKYVDNIGENTANGVPIPGGGTNLGGAIDAGMEKLASPIVKPTSYAFGKAADLAGASAKYFTAKGTGFDTSTIDMVRDHPGMFTPEAMQSMTRKSLGDEVGARLKERSAAVSETGSEYGTVRSSGAKVKVNPNYLENTISETTGLKVSKGKLSPTGKSSIRDASDVRALQQLYDLWKPEFKKGHLTADEYLNFRTDLGKMAKYGRELTSSKPLANLADIMRGKANTEFRGQLPGLKELDAQFGPQKSDYARLSKDFIDPKTGELKDAAINRIANATGKGKDALVARLEEIHPGITQRIRYLKAVEDIQNIHKVGTYSKAGLQTLEGGGLVGGIATGNIPLIAASIVSLLISQPEVAVRMIRGYGKYAQPIAQKVLQLVKKGGSAVNNLPETVATPARAVSVFGRQPTAAAQ